MSAVGATLEALHKKVSGTEAGVLDRAVRGSRSTCPGWMSARLLIPLARATAATEVWCRAAIAPRVSPARTR